MIRSVDRRLARLEQRVGVGAHPPLVVLWNPEDPDPTDGRPCIRVQWVDAPLREWTPPAVPKPTPWNEPPPEHESS